MITLIQNSRMVKQLIDKGADVNAMDWSGETPLHVAVATCSIDRCPIERQRFQIRQQGITKALILGSADTTYVTEFKTPMERAAPPVSRYIASVIEAIKVAESFYGFSETRYATTWLGLNPGAKVWIAQGAIVSKNNIHRFPQEIRLQIAGYLGLPEKEVMAVHAFFSSHRKATPMSDQLPEATLSSPRTH